MYLVPMMWTSVNPAGCGSVVAFCPAVAVLPALFVAAALESARVVLTTKVEVAVFSAGCVEDASVGVEAAIVSTGDVDAAVESVEVAATCARTGLTMANPIASTTRSALAPAKVMVLVLIIILIF